MAMEDVCAGKRKIAEAGGGRIVGDKLSEELCAMRDGTLV